MSVQHVSWFDLSEADKDRFYTAGVRAAFGQGALSDEGVAETFLPPMRRLESVQVEITTWCNLHCQQCTRTQGIAAGTWTNRHIDLDDYAKIIAKLPPAHRIILQGVGEPTLHPRFLDLARIARDSGKYGAIDFNTNGHSHDDAFWRHLAADYLCSVVLSVDSLDPEIAEICRKGTDVPTLEHQLRLFKEIFPMFCVATVASKLNLHDLPKTIRKIAALGEVRVAIQSVMTGDEGVALEPADHAWLVAQAAGLMQEFPGLQVTGADGNAGVSLGNKRCIQPFVAPFITIDGDLAPCCSGPDPTAYAHTSLLDDRNWDQIRSSEPVIDWFKSFLDEDPPMCFGCSFNPRRIEGALKTRLRVS